MNRRLWGGAALGVAAQLSGIGLLLTSAWLIVRAAEHPPVLYLMVAIVSVRFFGIGRAVFRYAERLLTHHAALTELAHLRVATYRSLERVAPMGLSRRRGDLVERIVADVERHQDLTLRVRLPWVYAVVSGVAVAATVATLTPTGALVMAVHVAVCLLAARAMGAQRPAHREARIAARARATLASESTALATMSRELTALGPTAAFTALAHRAVDVQRDLQVRQAGRSGSGAAAVLAATAVATAAAAWAAQDVTATWVGVVVLAPLALVEPMLAVVEAEQLRPATRAAHERLQEIWKVEDPLPDPLTPAAPVAGDDVTARGATVGWRRPVTAPIDLDLRIGEVVGVHGRSGCGKSTLAAALTRLAPTFTGTITMDGTDLRDLTGADVRRCVGLASQDDVVFDTSVRENLLVASPEATDADLTAALRRVGLDRLVTDRTDGLDLLVGHRGRALSGGERQRLCLARLLLADHRFLVIDEPTEHLDDATARALIADIATWRAGHGLVLISHDPSVLEACDRVVEIRAADELPRHEPTRHQLTSV